MDRDISMGDFTGSIQSEVGFGCVDALIVRLKERDEAAFTEVFERYKDLVYTLSCKLLADKAEAMDVTQEVFFSLFRKIDRFRGECSLKTWLYRVTLNQAANRNRWWKRRSRNRTVPLSLGLDGGRTMTAEPASPQPRPDRQVYSAELQKAIHKGLSRLPFEQRAAVVLRDVQGLRYEEIAEVVGTNVGTVKSRIARGRERLREILKEYRIGGQDEL